MPKHEERGFRGPRPFWSGTIAFGLVNLPVGLYPAQHSRDLSLREVDEDGTPLSRRFFSEHGRKPLKPREVVRGIEVADDRYVVVEEQEIEDAALEHRREIELSRFVAIDELDPFYFRRAYFLVPDKGALKPYRLLAEAMERAGRAGIATLVMRGREALVAILAEGGILRAEALRFHDELRSPESVGLEEPEEPPSQRERQLRQAMERLNAKTLDPDELIDPHMTALKKRVRQKRRRHEDVIPASQDDREAANDEDQDSAEVIDLMQVLKRSLKRGRVEPPDDRNRDNRSQKKAARNGSSRRRQSSSRSSKSSKASQAELSQLSRDALYERAQALDIPGRSRLSKAELVEAIQSRQ